MARIGMIPEVAAHSISPAQPMVQYCQPFVVPARSGRERAHPPCADPPARRSCRSRSSASGASLRVGRIVASKRRQLRDPRVRNFVHARGRAAGFITRIGWQSVRLFDMTGQRFVLFAVLPETGPAVVEHHVRIGAGRTPVRRHRVCPVSRPHRKPPIAACDVPSSPSAPVEPVARY